MQPDNDHNVYILGAGFSKDAGLPLVDNFLEKMREAHPWLLKQNRGREAEAITAVLQFRLESAAAAYWIQMDLENIEELFSLASAYPNQMERDVRLAIAATIEYAQASAEVIPVRVQFSGKGQALMGTWGLQAPDNAEHFLINPYRLRIARLLGLLKNGKPQGRNTFITFNYDTVLEDNLKAIGVPFSYRFAADEARFKSSASGDSNSSNVSVLKIHGSINWAWQSDAEKTLVFESYQELRAKKLAPQLIPPTWKKGYQRQFSTVMERAAQLLQSATRVIVIGFSMPTTDVHFKYMLAAGFAKNISLRKVWFIDPAADELKLRASAHFKAKYVSDERVSFQKMGFAEMANEFGLLRQMDRTGPRESLYSIYS